MRQFRLNTKLMIIRQAKSLFLLMLCLLIFSSKTAHARSENEIKAVYLYNFIKFITWPQEPTTSDINICIYGDSPFGQQTDKLIATVPEVLTVFGKVGRAETATDPAPLSNRPATPVGPEA